MTKEDDYHSTRESILLQFPLIKHYFIVGNSIGRKLKDFKKNPTVEKVSPFERLERFDPLHDLRELAFKGYEAYRKVCQESNSKLAPFLPDQFAQMGEELHLLPIFGDIKISNEELIRLFLYMGYQLKPHKTEFGSLPLETDIIYNPLTSIPREIREYQDGLFSKEKAHMYDRYWRGVLRTGAAANFGPPNPPRPKLTIIR